jgi:hypothetical protein
MVQENEKWLELNATRQVLVIADGVNILCGKNTIKKHTEALLEARGEVGLDVNTEKSKYKYLRATVTNPNCTHEEIKCSLSSGNAC